MLLQRGNSQEAADEPLSIVPWLSAEAGAGEALDEDSCCDSSVLEHKGQGCSTNESQTIPANIGLSAAPQAEGQPG